MKQLLLSLFLIFLSFQALRACDCPDTPHMDSVIANSNVIFRGKCIDKNTNWVSSGMKYTFAIEESWVRTIEPFTTINSPSAGAGSCGYPFQVGEEYLVYVNKKFSLKTSLCDPTKPLSEAGEDLEYLGPGLEISASPGAGMLKTVMIFVPILVLVFVVFIVMSGKIMKKKKAQTS